jgi:hypothetical protein
MFTTNNFLHLGGSCMRDKSPLGNEYNDSKKGNKMKSVAYKSLVFNTRRSAVQVCSPVLKALKFQCLFR